MADGMQPGGGNAIRDNLSITNPTDAAYMAQKGMVSGDMTMKDYLESKYKIPITASVKEFAAAMKEESKAVTPVGKMGQIAGSQPAQRMPQGRRPMAQPQGAQQPYNLQTLMNNVGG